jgi:hypothetical protein
LIKSASRRNFHSGWQKLLQKAILRDILLSKMTKRFPMSRFAVLDYLRNRKEQEVQGETYLTTEELSARIKYDARTIRERLKDSVLIEGVHYIRPFGGRKILYIWEAITRDMASSSASGVPSIPMARGGVVHG